MSVTRCEVSENARLDLARQYEWYELEAGVDIAERYLQAFQQTAQYVTNHPVVGILRRFRDPRLKGIRSVQVHGAFRVHLVFYRIEEDVLVIFRVLHGMRDLPRRLIEPPDSDA